MNSTIISSTTGLRPAILASEIAEVLSALSCVRKIALFGSLATDTADAWSDIDMTVACDSPETDSWAAAKAIIAARPIIYYREFSQFAHRPSGRYFFEGESPLNRLDISFHSIEEYESYLVTPERYGYAITLREIYASESPDCSPARPHTEPFLYAAGEHEREIGGWLHFALRAIKYTLRTGRPIEKDIPRLPTIRETLSTVSPDAVMSGGRIGELSHQVLQLAEDTHLI